MKNYEEEANWRVDGVDKVTGEARYTFDVVLPGMLHAKLLRSPHAHARIKRIDCSRARALPGVAVVVSGEDLAGLRPYYGAIIQDQPILAIDKVRYVGDVVAAVAAEDDRTAYKALALIEVDYELLSEVATIEQALSADAPALFDRPQRQVKGMPPSAAKMRLEPEKNVLLEYSYEHGDIDDAFAGCDHVFEDVFSTSKIGHFHLEPHVTVAHRRSDRLDIWACTQDPFDLRGEISHMFGLPQSKICIHTSYVGGGFGGKSFCKTEPVAVLLASKVRRPVRLCLSMDEGFNTICSSEAILRLKTGVMSDGTLVARQNDILINSGAYSDANALVTMKMGYRIGGLYRWKALKTLSRSVRTNTVPGGSFRGFGGTQAAWATESQVDMIARRLNIDPYEMRVKNLLDANEPLLPNDRLVDSRIRDGLSIVADRIGYHGRSRKEGRGIGLSVAFKDGAGFGSHGHAVVKVTPDGGIIVSAGTVEIGQGAATTACRIAARVLNAKTETAQYARISSEQTLLDPGTRGSSGVVLIGKAVELAASEVRAKVLSFAADRLQCGSEELDLVDWIIMRGNMSFPVHDLILKYFGPFGYEFVAEGFVKSDLDPRAPLGFKGGYFQTTWVAAEVEVDRSTGVVNVLNLVVAADAGSAVNLKACVGQVEGAAAQAFGQAMFEQIKYNGANPVDSTPWKYRLPLSVDLPDRFEGIIFEHMLGNGPFGSKGLGEAGILGIPSAIANAIEDAIGVRVNSTPMTPETVLAAIDRAAQLH